MLYVWALNSALMTCCIDDNSIINNYVGLEGPENQLR